MHCTKFHWTSDNNSWCFFLAEFNNDGEVRQLLFLGGGDGAVSDRLTSSGVASVGRHGRAVYGMSSRASWSPRNNMIFFVSDRQHDTDEDEVEGTPEETNLGRAKHGHEVWSQSRRTHGWRKDAARRQGGQRVGEKNTSSLTFRSSPAFSVDWRLRSERVTASVADRRER